MMTDIKKKRYRWLHVVWLLFGVILLAGCIDDDLICSDEVPAGTLPPDEYGIGFEVVLGSLDGGAMTRAGVANTDDGNQAENYVNFNSMRILFFTKDDEFICDLLTDTEACNVIDRSKDENERRWYIEIRLSKLGDKYEDKIRTLIEEDGFKIAVFANWDRRTTTATKPHPDFVSILDTEEVEKYPKKTKLSYIAHNIPDPTYYASVSEEGVQHSAYTHLYQEGEDEDGNSVGLMGAWYDWVESHFVDKNEADFLMRSGLPMKTDKNADSNNQTDNENNLDGQGDAWRYEDTSDATVVELDEEGNKGFWYSRTERDGETYIFKNIWNLWNFSVGNEKVFPYSNQNKSAYNEQWRDINAPLGEFAEQPQTGKQTISDGTFNKLELNLRSADTYSNSNGVIRLEKTLNNKTDGSNITEGYICFWAETVGTLHVRANASSGAYVGIHTQGMKSSASENLKVRQWNENGNSLTDNRAVFDVKDYSFDIKVSGDPIPVYVYAVGGSVEFYEIEFVKDDYLAKVDRIGKEPKYLELGIPMYGIQEFEGVKDYWLPGEYFNVSTWDMKNTNAEIYPYRHIWMLRSVAKVELKVSKSLGGNAQKVKPSSVYMASMNRTSRYEPKDFSTPTNLIWYGTDYYGGDKNYDYKDKYNYGNTGIDKIVGVDQEAENIKQYGPIYDSTKGDPTGEEYRNFTAWVYGIWTKIPCMEWDWNKQNVIVTNKDNLPYPRIFNDRVWRSNSTRFIFDKEASENDDYWHYYIYVPEKYQDDADDAGDRSASPKVSSIRLRFKDNLTDEPYNDDTNLEDSRSFRIYFTKGGIAEGSGIVGRDYDSYEKNRGNMLKHWPVIRNTLYRFTLNGLNSTDIKVEVCTPAERNVTIPSFD